MRTEITKVYRTLHTWVGIGSGLLLFVGFYCGAFTMLKEPLSHWAATPSGLPAAPPLEDTPRLIELATTAHPESRKGYTVHLEIGPATPARLTWEIRPPGSDDHAPARVFGASLDAAGTVVVKELQLSPATELIDHLHRQLGLPIHGEIGEFLVGFVTLLYVLALVSGVVILLPTLVKTLFLLRTEARQVRRLWLDVHNALGFLSLPFHLVIALTAVVFTLHDPFYAAQAKILGPNLVGGPPSWAAGLTKGDGPLLSPLEICARIEPQAPEFALKRLHYTQSPAGVVIRAIGGNAREMTIGPTWGFAMVDPRTGILLGTDYLPGKQPKDFTLITSFFSLHFGSFGGPPVRWSYLVLGFAGAFLFYTGNLLWIEGRRRRQADAAGSAKPGGATRLLAVLTVGISLGTISGVSLTLMAARWLPATPHLRTWHEALFYGAVVASLGWAWWRGPARAGYELLWACAGCSFAITLSGLAGRWLALGLPVSGPWTVECLGLGTGILLASFARIARRRAWHGASDSLWSAR